MLSVFRSRSDAGRGAPCARCCALTSEAAGGGPPLAWLGLRLSSLKFRCPAARPSVRFGSRLGLNRLPVARPVAWVAPLPSPFGEVRPSPGAFPSCLPLLPLAGAVGGAQPSAPDGILAALRNDSFALFAAMFLSLSPRLSSRIQLPTLASRLATSH